MRDAFYRWDGFSFYASFLDFLPSVALASILWSIVSVFTAILAWMLFKILEWFCNLIRIEIGIEHLLIYTCIFVLSGALVWKGKKLIWPDVQTTFQIKLLVFLFISVVSILIVRLFRDKAKQCAGILIQSITPLVWLFGIFVILAVPLVVYCTWVEGVDKTASRNITEDFSVDKNRPNIIFVTFDALAARNMSAYGYHKETTPFISKWSRNATVFTMAETESNFTTPAAASLMTGKRVWTHQTYHIAGTKPIRGKFENLPAVLKKYGYFNMALVVNPFASVNILGMSDSFDIAPPAAEFGTSASLFGWKFGIVDKMLYRAFAEKIRLHNWIIRNDFIFSKVINLISRNIYQTTVPLELAFKSFIDLVDADLPEHFFAWIHVFPPHDPYLPPVLAAGENGPARELNSYKGQERLIEDSYTYLFQYKPYPDEMKPAVELMRNYYDEFIKYCDKQFEAFIEELSRRNLENTIIILSADHGESFDHGYFTHGGPFLYEQVTNIPLIIKEPGQEEGRLVETVVEQIDIPATILDIAGLPVPEWMEGRSLTPAMRGKELPQRPAFAMNFEGNRSRGHKITRGSVAVWKGDYKLINYLDKDVSLLFNLKDDPEELEDLTDKRPELSKELLNIISDNLSKTNERIRDN
jgi:arylsulfatase A-like enzyme